MSPASTSRVLGIAYALLPSWRSSRSDPTEGSVREAVVGQMEGHRAVDGTTISDGYANVRVLPRIHATHPSYPQKRRFISDTDLIECLI